MAPDLSQYSTEELLAAYKGAKPTAAPDLSGFSTEELLAAYKPATQGQGIGAGLVQGIKNLPSDVMKIPSGLFSLGKSVVKAPTSLESAEQAARGVGSLSAGTAGALAGAQVGATGGALFGPLGAAAGGLLGGAVGGGLGLFGFNKLNQLTGSDAPTTPQQDLYDLGYNTAQGAALGGAAKALGGTKNFLKGQAQKLDRKSVGATYGDYKKSANDLQMIEAADGGVETLTKRALDDLLEKENLPYSRDPAKLVEIVGNKTTELAKKIDDAIKGHSKQVVPEFDNALRFIVDGKVPADQVGKYMTRLDALDKAIKAEGRGSLSYLQQQKIAVGKSWDTSDGIMNDFNRAVYADLQKAIESAVPEVKPLNAQLQKFKILDPIVKRKLAEAEASDPISKAISIGKTTGGFGVPIYIASQALGPIAGPALGYGIGSALSNVSGKALLSDVAGGMSKAAGTAGGMAPVLGPITSVATPERRESASRSTGKGPAQQANQLFAPTSPAPRNQKDDLSSSLNDAGSPAPNQAAQFKRTSYEPNPLFSIRKPMDSGRPPVEMVEAEIDKDPYFSALYEAESGRNPRAKNPESSAKGGFQFLDGTARLVGLKDPMDLAESFNKVRSLTDDHRAKFGDDPATLYAAHHLGATVLNKWLTGKELSDKEQAQISYFKEKALPRFMNIYGRVSMQRTGVTEA